MTPSERKEIVMKAYERLKISLDKFLKPDGSKDAPAKTCGDIKHHHPDFESGEYIYNHRVLTAAQNTHTTYHALYIIQESKKRIQEKLFTRFVTGYSI